MRSTATGTLVTNGLSTTSGAPWSGSAKCYILVEDWQSSDNYDPASLETMYSSGINNVTYGGVTCNLVDANTVTLPGETNSNTVINTYHGSVGRAWYVYPYDITENVENAKVEVVDNVGKSSGNKLVSLYHLDNVAPVVESAIVKNGTTAIGGTTWYNNPLILTLTIVDYATTGTIALTRRAAGVSNITMTATQFSRNAYMTEGGTQTAISVSYNPSTSHTSGSNPDGSYYMQRVGYVMSQEYVTGGVTYYCYRYVIEVPILYHTDYSFSISDKAVNANGVKNTTTQFKYSHTASSVASYKPLIDETTPKLSRIEVTGYTAAGASVGSAKTSYVSANYLVFEIIATDSDDGGINNGSGINNIRIYKDDTYLASSLVSEWTGTAYQSSTSGGKLLYVYDDDYGGVVDINSCSNASYYIVITDQAGNSTTAVPAETFTISLVCLILK